MSTEREQALRFMDGIMTEAEKQWTERALPEIRQTMVEIGRSEADLQRLDDMEPHLRNTFLAGVSLGVVLLIEANERRGNQ